MKSKYTRNSLIHQALESLDRQPRSPEELRTMLINISISRFNEYVTVPLLTDGLAKDVDGLLQLTEEGRDKLAELGLTKQKLPYIYKKAVFEPYEGKELRKAAVREGADDHLKLPSRVGNTLRYRDGRIEELS